MRITSPPSLSFAKIPLLGVFLFASSLFADPLPSNYLTGISAAGEGALWSWSAEGLRAVSYITLQEEEGRLRARSIATSPQLEELPSVPAFPRQLSDYRFSGSASAVVQNHLFLPAYVAQQYGEPHWLALLRFDLSAPREQAVQIPLSFDLTQLAEGEVVAPRRMAVQNDTLWISAGAAGLLRLSHLEGDSVVVEQIALDTSAKSWSVTGRCGGESECLIPPGAGVQSVFFDTTVREVQVEAGAKRWALLSSQALSPRNDGPPLQKGEELLGRWSCGAQQWSQTVESRSGELKGKLWNRTAGGEWGRVDSVACDTLAVLLHHLECLGERGIAAFHSLESYRNGLIWLDKRAIELVEIPGQRAVVSDLALVPSGNGDEKWIAAATYGWGIALSSDSGATWSALLNQTEVQGDLREIRTIPSLLSRNGIASRIAYRLSAKSKVTIELYSYDMRKIRTLVRDEIRPADPHRSSNSDRDLWDGRDEEGRYLSSGLYYIRVSDDRGHEGWGKVYKSAGAE